MAKQQKNLQLPESVVRWLEQSEIDTGASQARTMVAALAQWVMSEDAVQSFWMRISGFVESEKLSFDDLRERMSEWEVEGLRSAVRAMERSKELAGSPFLAQTVEALNLAEKKLAGIQRR